MGIVNNINYIKEPNPLACGQAVLSMLLGVSVEDVIKSVETDREITLKQLKNELTKNGVSFINQRFEVYTKEDLPDVAILSLETPRCWHWSLYCYGKFYDPEHGVLDDFPTSIRKYYWEIITKEL